MSQIMDFIPRHEFNRIVSKYKGNYRFRTFSCWDQFLTMSFAQLSYRESLRDIEASLNAQRSRLYHMGVRGTVARVNLARANENRDWRIYAEIAQILISKARKLYSDDSDFQIELDNTIYALDSTTIDLCLSLFPWAKFRRRKGAIKLHTLLDLRGSIPTFIEITDGSVHDLNILDLLIVEPSAYYIMDRGYMDFQRLHTIHQSAAYFVLRSRKRLSFRRLYSHPVDKSDELRCDQIIKLTGPKSSKFYPDKLRRVKIFDPDRGGHIVLLTNNFILTPELISQLYKSRWQIELFFKWIKQHLRIKAFYGTSSNAVKTQVWIAICTYLLVAIIKKTLKIDHSLYTILQIFSVCLFEKVPIYQLLTDANSQYLKEHPDNQLNLFNI
jgi:transposase